MFLLFMKGIETTIRGQKNFFRLFMGGIEPTRRGHKSFFTYLRAVNQQPAAAEKSLTYL